MLWFIYNKTYNRLALSRIRVEIFPPQTIQSEKYYPLDDGTVSIILSGERQRPLAGFPLSDMTTENYKEGGT